MIVKQIIDEDFVNYKKVSMFVAFPRCSFKCEKECGKHVCQNSILATTPNITIPTCKLVKRYIENNISQSIICGGLEPFDSWEMLFSFIYTLREITNDDIVIYTGYNNEEIADKIYILKKNFSNIIVKFGRFIPDQEKHYDEVLGVYLASPNQYAERIS